MGLLEWLGLQRGDEYPNLDALRKELRRALPEDEGVLLRYVAIVAVLLAKIAWADGRFCDADERTLRRLLSHIDRLAPSGVDAICQVLRGTAQSLREEELALCYRELRALCDGRERVEVMRLLAELAAADGALSAAEHAELATIAAELGVSPADLAGVEKEASSSRV